MHTCSLTGHRILREISVCRPVQIKHLTLNNLPKVCLKIGACFYLSSVSSQPIFCLATIKGTLANIVDWRTWPLIKVHTVCIRYRNYINHSNNKNLDILAAMGHRPVKVVMVEESTWLTLGKHAYSNTLKILLPKNGNFSDKKFWYFSYFCSKHRLWVLIRTSSLRRF